FRRLRPFGAPISCLFYSTAPLLDRTFGGTINPSVSHRTTMDSALLNRRPPGAIDLLLTRRSGSAKAMTGPGPDADQLRTILTAATRVPDHGKLFPWRFVLFEGDARARFGEVLAGCLPKEEATPERLAMERGRFLRAPVVVGVISKVRDGIPIPVWEQQMSSGAVCQTILFAATALGFVANWLTEWPA